MISSKLNVSFPAHHICTQNLPSLNTILKHAIVEFADQEKCWINYLFGEETVRAIGSKL